MRSVLLSLVLALLVPQPPPARAVAASRAASAGAASPAAPAARKVPKLKVKAVVTDVDHPWDVQSLPGGALLFTQRDRATLSLFRNGQGASGSRVPERTVWVSGETGLMGLEVDPDFAENRRIYTCQGWLHRRRRPRRPGHRLDPGRAATKATQDKVLVGGFPTSSRAARRLPAADRPPTGRCSSAPATRPIGTNPRRTSTRSAARRCGSTGSRARRGRATRSPTRHGPRRYVHTFGHRNVQGLAAARRRHAVVDRAGHLPRRRGQPARQRRRLRLQPGARLQRVGADDRPGAARHADRGQLELRQPDAWRRPAALRLRHASGAPSTARSRWPASRPAGCCS